MEEQKEFNLKLQVVDKAIKEVINEKIEVIEKRQEETIQFVKPVFPPREEQQTPIVWCGGKDFSQDVTIFLVPNRINQFLNKGTEHHKQTLAKVKVHSSRLSKCSKYFETCLTERWKKTSSTSSLEFVLETHVEIPVYVDCFSRVYSPPFFKDFKDVNYSLRLLKAASQIQFHELMDSISLYLSSKLWSDTDEMAIRMYSTFHDFPRNHAQDLVVRLGMDESEEDCHKRLCDVIEQCIRTALAYDGNFRSNRDFFKEMLLGSGPGSGLNTELSNKPGSVFRQGSIFSNGPSNGPGNGLSNGLGNGLSNGPTSGLSVLPNCMTDVVTIVSREAKDMVVNVGRECEGKTYLSVPRFADKILAICWILGTLLAAKVAEEFVQCFVHLHAIPKILAIESPTNVPTPAFGANYYRENSVHQRDARNAAVELAELVLVMYQEVAAGNLLLKTPERIALLENWHLVLGKLLVPGINCNFDHATKDLFMTLPLKQQMELVKSRKDSSYESYISTNSLAILVKRKWPAMEVKLVASSPPSSS